MTASEITSIISEAIKQAESEAFDARVEELSQEGWANPTLQAQSEWQGHDNGIQFGSMAEADDDLVEALEDAERIGDGAPLAYVGVDGYYTLICEGATREEIEKAAVDCLPDFCEEAE